MIKEIICGFFGHKPHYHYKDRPAEGRHPIYEYLICDRCGLELEVRVKTDNLGFAVYEYTKSTNR